MEVTVFLSVLIGIFKNNFLRPHAFWAPSLPLYGHSRLRIFHGLTFFKTATFEESGRDGGHMATLVAICALAKVRRHRECWHCLKLLRECKDFHRWRQRWWTGALLRVHRLPPPPPLWRAAEPLTSRTSVPTRVLLGDLAVFDAASESAGLFFIWSVLNTREHENFTALRFPSPSRG
jgi:hypothetical protein